MNTRLSDLERTVKNQLEQSRRESVNELAATVSGGLSQLSVRYVMLWDAMERLAGNSNGADGSNDVYGELLEFCPELESERGLSLDAYISACLFIATRLDDLGNDLKTLAATTQSTMLGE